MNSNESNIKNGLPVEIKAIINKPVTALFLCFIAGLCITSVVFIWKATLNFNIDDALIAFIVTGLAACFVALLPSLHYSMTFNSDNFSYKQSFFKGTVSYTDIKALYRIKTQGRYGGYSYRLVVKLNSGRTLKFSLDSLDKSGLELLEKLFKVRARKSYIDKNSIF